MGCYGSKTKYNGSHADNNFTYHPGIQHRSELERFRKAEENDEIPEDINDIMLSGADGVSGGQITLEKKSRDTSEAREMVIFSDRPIAQGHVFTALLDNVEILRSKLRFSIGFVTEGLTSEVGAGTLLMTSCVHRATSERNGDVKLCPHVTLCDGEIVVLSWVGDTMTCFFDGHDDVIWEHKNDALSDNKTLTAVIICSPEVNVTPVTMFSKSCALNELCAGQDFHRAYRLLQSRHVRPDAMDSFRRTPIDWTMLSKPSAQRFKMLELLAEAEISPFARLGRKVAVAASRHRIPTVYELRNTAKPWFEFDYVNALLELPVWMESGCIHACSSPFSLLSLARATGLSKQIVVRVIGKPSQMKRW